VFCNYIKQKNLFILVGFLSFWTICFWRFNALFYVPKPDCNGKPVSEESRFIGTDLEWEAGLTLLWNADWAFQKKIRLLFFGKQF